MKTHTLQRLRPEATREEKLEALLYMVIEVALDLKNGYTLQEIGVSLDDMLVDAEELGVSQPHWRTVSRCPWCGLSGLGYDESPAPSDYCHHE